MLPKILLAAAIALAPAFANAQDKTPSARQNCNLAASAKKLKGEERKAFVKSCLTAEAGAAKPAAQTQPQPQQKMKDCNKQAGSRKGGERKTFLSACLKG
jgi:hypothetical protein